jgi:nitroreductase
MRLPRQNRDRRGRYRPRRDKRVKRDIHDLLPPCPEPGQGVHAALLGAVSRLGLMGFDEEEIPDMIQYPGWLSRPPKAREIEDCLAKVFAEGDPRDADYVPREKFPDADVEQILELAHHRPDALEELTVSSLIQEQISVEEWLQVFYRPEDLLCIMETSWDVTIKPLSEWLGYVARARYAVPNAFRDAFYGRTISNVLFRRYVVTETDLAPMLVKLFKLNQFDLQAALILYLRELNLLQLRSVVFSGNKSLHAWWEAQDEAANRSFFSKAVAIGADRSLFTLNHSARLCNPSERQLLLYLG